MSSYALLIGIDRYQPESGLRPLTTAAAAARRMGGWLAAQGWVAPERIRLLYADASQDELAATRAAIGAALLELQQLGAQAEPGDRLYVMFAGYAAGNFGDQLLLLPQDTWIDAYGDSALPWPDLERWLRGSGFPTQHCFLATCHADGANLAEALLDASLPLDQAVPTASVVDQHIFISIQESAADPGDEACALFSQVLHAGLEGAATESTNREAAERVIHYEALVAYLEQEIPIRSAGHLRCIIAGSHTGNPIIARLGPAPLTELHVEIQPPEAAAHTTVTIAYGIADPILDERSGPPFQFRVVRDSSYVIIARAPDYQEVIHYIRAAGSPCVIQLKPPGDRVLGGNLHAMAELLIQPEEPALPVRLFNSYGYVINLPPKRPRGYLIRTPPDRYRGQLVAPERNIEREIEAQASQTTILVLPLDPAPEPRALDRLLTALDRGQLLNVRPATSQAALVVLAQGIPDPLSIAPMQPGYQPPITPAQVPADVVALLRQSYLGAPEPLWLTFANADGEQHQLLLPLLPGHTTIVGLDGSGSGMPIIEILVTAGPLLRRNLAVQKRILWAQRFFRAERRSFIPALVEGLDDEPLALILAGYSALVSGDGQRALTYALRLQTLVPTSADAALLLHAVNPEQHATAPGAVQAHLPSLLVGLQHLVSRLSAATIHPLAYLAFQRAVLSQIWLVVRGSDIHLTTADPARHTAAPQREAPHTTPREAPVNETTPISPVDVLLITVTDVETKAVLTQFSRALQQPFARRFIGDKTYFSLGSVNGANTVLVQSEMGAGGPSGSLLTVAASIQALRPGAIIMIGIAFGIDPARQGIGDILVAQQILDYELQRVGTGPSGDQQIRPRGERPACSPRLLDRFRSGAIDWKGAPLHFGLVLSGAKLVDNQGFRDQLRGLEPEAIGGEMEGAGLYAAAQREKIDWILIKAICDYADGQKGLDKAKRQRIAAQNATRFVLHVLRQGGFATSGRSQAQMPEQRPPSQPADPGIADSPSTVSRSVLRHVLEQYFNESELHTLCFNLGIDYEQLSGTNKSDKARELVTYAERHGRLSELEMRCRALRPNAEW